MPQKIARVKVKRALLTLATLSGAKVFVPRVVSDTSRSLFAVKKSQVKTSESCVLQITGEMTQQRTSSAQKGRLLNPQLNPKP